MFDRNNTYWNRRGALQAQYDEMLAAGWEFNFTSQHDMNRYFRYYNDGDAPARIRFLWNMLGYQLATQNAEVLAYEERLEAAANLRVEIEYRRFKRAQEGGAHNA